MAPCVLGEQSKIKTWKCSVIINDSYLSLGFTYTCDETVPDALRTLCNKVLKNSSVLPSKLHRYCDPNHPKYKDKDISFIRCKSEALPKCQSLMVKSSKTDNENATEASYSMSYHIALAREEHIVAETIINHVRWQQQLVCLSFLVSWVYWFQLEFCTTLLSTLHHSSVEVYTQLMYCTTVSHTWLFIHDSLQIIFA